MVCVASEKTMKCPLNCGKSINNSDSDNKNKHFYNCSKSLILCHKCKCSFERSEKALHKSICSYEEIKCEKCKQKIFRINKEFHEKSECPESN